MKKQTNKTMSIEELYANIDNELAFEGGYSIDDDYGVNYGIPLNNSGCYAKGSAFDEDDDYGDGNSSLY